MQRDITPRAANPLRIRCLSNGIQAPKNNANLNPLEPARADFRNHAIRLRVVSISLRRSSVVPCDVPLGAAMLR